MEKSYTYDRITLRYDDDGEGETLLLLHGWGCDRNVWSGIRPILTKHFRVISVDFAGFGRSDEPQSVWGVEDYTRSIEALVRHIGAERPTLVGHSFGGRVAILYASRNATQSVILADAAGIRPRRPLSYYYKVYSYKAMKRLLPILVGGTRDMPYISSSLRATPMTSAAANITLISSRAIFSGFCHSSGSSDSNAVTISEAETIATGDT